MKSNKKQRIIINTASVMIGFTSWFFFKISLLFKKLAFIFEVLEWKFYLLSGDMSSIGTRLIMKLLKKL